MRARLEMPAAPWRALRRDDAATWRQCGRLTERHGLTPATWSTLRDDAGLATMHRSAPLPLRAALSLRAELMGLAPDLRVAAERVHTHAHLAGVDRRGVVVVYGAATPMLSAADAEVRGVPVATITGDAVAPYDAAVYGHTDDELRAAVRYGRQRAEVAA